MKIQKQMRRQAAALHVSTLNAPKHCQEELLSDL